MKTKTVSKEIHVRGQKADYVEVLQATEDDEGEMLDPEHKLRVSIRSDSYKDQCYARIKRWDGTKWQLVHSILEMKTKDSLAYGSKPATAANFAADRKELLRVAEAIL